MEQVSKDIIAGGHPKTPVVNDGPAAQHRVQPTRRNRGDFPRQDAL